MMLQNVSEHLRNLKDAHSQLNFFKRDSTLINLNLGGLYLQNINRNITMEEPNQECQGNKELIRTGLTNITNY